METGYDYTVFDLDYFLMPTHHYCLHGGQSGDCHSSGISEEWFKSC